MGTASKVSEPTRARGQWGVTQDDFGRLYYSTNSDLGRVDPLASAYFSRNPYYNATAAQVGMVVAGHYSAAVAGGFALGGMGISLIAPPIDQTRKLSSIWNE